jgi:hypothetical protein
MKHPERPIPVRALLKKGTHEEHGFWGLPLSLYEGTSGLPEVRKKACLPRSSGNPTTPLR